MAGATIKFKDNVSDSELPNYLQNAEAFIFPGVDDFGIAPVEAMAAGCPVIAYRAGGAIDTVKENVSGVFFDKQGVESLKDAITDFERRRFSQDRIAAQAQQFSKELFQHKISELIDK